jgi:hypothetical protein
MGVWGRHGTKKRRREVLCLCYRHDTEDKKIKDSRARLGRSLKLMGVSREHRVGVLIRTVYIDLHNPVENISRYSCEGGVPQSFRKGREVSVALLGQKPSPLFISFGCRRPQFQSPP